MSQNIIRIVVFLFLFAPFVHAENLIAIRAGRLVDVEKGTILKDQILLIRGERIESILPSTGSVPSEAKVLDLSKYTVLPGLIDCHAHLIGEMDAYGAKALEYSSAQYAFAGVKNGKLTLNAGFTGVRDIGTWRAYVDVALRNAINEGIVTGPRMAACGAYVTVSNGAGDLNGLAPDIVLPKDLQAGIANSVDEVRMRVRQILTNGADFIKILATGAVLTVGSKPGVQEFTEEELRAAVTEAAKYGAKVACHAHGAEGIKAAVRAGVASIEHGSLIDDEGIRLMKEHGTYLVADIYNGDYIAAEYKRLGFPEEFLIKNEQTTDAQRIGFRKAVQAGVNIAYGTDSGVYPHRDSAKQLQYMVKYGMTPMGAIQSATIQAAKLIGWEKNTGSIVVGKYADIIAVEGDALADLNSFMNVAFVMKGGEIIKSLAEAQSPKN